MKASGLWGKGGREVCRAPQGQSLSQRGLSGAAEDSVVEWEGPHGAHFYTSLQINPGYRDQDLGPSRTTPHKDGGREETTDFIPGLEDSESFLFSGGDKR